eukprot:UN33676
MIKTADYTTRQWQITGYISMKFFIFYYMFFKTPYLRHDRTTCCCIMFRTGSQRHKYEENTNASNIIANPIGSTLKNIF